MLGKSAKVARGSFSSVTKKGRRFQGAFFSLTVLPEGETVRLSVVVSKAVAAKATDRNRLKRVSYAALQQHLNFSHKPPFAAVLFAKKGAGDATAPDIRKDVYDLLAKAAII